MTEISFDLKIWRRLYELDTLRFTRRKHIKTIFIYRIYSTTISVLRDDIHINDIDAGSQASQKHILRRSKQID